MFHQNLTKTEKQIVEECTGEGEGFDGMVKQIKESLKRNKSAEGKDKQFWMGTRMEVEMPDSKAKALKKSFEPEILSQKFFLTEEYHHYDDWKAMMEGTYDQFNLLQIPKENSKENPIVYFDSNDFNRRIPKGIFPHPNHKRVILE